MKYILDERYRLRGWQGAPTGLFDTKRKAPAFLERPAKNGASFNLDDGRFAGSSRSDDRNSHSLLYPCAEVVDDRLSGNITEFDVIKYHFSGDDRCVERFLGVRLFRLVKEFKDTLGCGRHSLDHVADLGKLGNGLGKTFHILNK